MKGGDIHMAIDEDALFDELNLIKDKLDNVNDELSSVYSNQASTSTIEDKLDDIIRLLKQIKNNQD
jgi:hypothetical protein